MMKIHKLRNYKLEVNISSLGAEIQSIKNVSDDYEYIWSGDPQYWSRHASNLFPVVGKIKDDFFIYNDKEYKMMQHGFARDLEFELVNQKDNLLDFQLLDSNETKLLYPFKFEFHIIYELDENNISIKYLVKNTDKKEIYFSLGGHPAFNIKQNSKIYFEPKKEFETKKLENRLVIEKDSNLDLSEIVDVGNELLAETLVINTKEQYFEALLEIDDKHSIAVSSNNAKYFALWEPKNSNKKLIAIEPWWGISDSENSDHNIKNKKSIITLESGKEFSSSFEIKIKSF